MRAGRTFLALSASLGALVFVAFLHFGQGAIAQSAPPAMSVAERKAAFEQALRYRQAGKYREALETFAKAGSAGHRRAAAWAAIAYEEGTGTSGGADGAAEWHVVAATGGLNRNIPVHIEWLGNGAIRYHVKPDHQRVTIRADGSWTRELLHERIRVKDGAQTLESEDAPEYVINEDADGNVTVADWRGNWWSLDAAAPEDRLTRDARSGDLTFTDDLKQTVTVRQNGRRTVTRDSGRWEMDLGGRLIGAYDAKGKAVNQYQHNYRGVADPELTRFISKGALWGMTPVGGGRQRWTLLNGDDPRKPVHMDVRISMNRANSVVFEDGNRRRIETVDGTVVEESQRKDPGGMSVTEKKVGDRQGKTAYTLLTYRRGTIFKQELKSGAGRFIGEGKDYRSVLWWAVDASGRRKPGTASAGDMFIDDNGTLIKRGYASEPDPSRPGDIRIRHDAQGNPIVAEVTYIYTSAESEQWFSHGGVIRRDVDGGVLWTVTPGGETTRYHYSGEGDDKNISGIREGANPRWAWVGHFASRSPSRDNLATASSVSVSINRKSGDAVWEDTTRKTQTTFRVDGSRQYVTGNEKSQRVIEVDAKGRTTRFLTPVNPEFRLYYADDGRLERVDHTYDQGYSIVETDYKAPPALPLTAKQVLRGTQLEFLGWKDERYVSFLNTDGHRVNFWGGATVEEHAGEASAPLVRVVLRGDLTISKKGADGLSFWAAPAETIHGVSGDGWARSVTYTDSAGRRFQRFQTGALSELDSEGRLVEHTAGPSRVFKFGYADAKSGRLDSATTPARSLRRGQLPADVVDFQLTTNRFLVITLASGFEIHDLQNDERTTIRADGTRSTYDYRDRLMYQEDLDGKSTFLFYEAEGTTPVKRGEAGGIKAAREGTATLELGLEHGQLQTLERTVQARDGTTTTKLIVRREGSGWIDEERVRYSTAWISEAPRRAFLATSLGRFIRVIDEDGAETLVSFDDRYQTRSRVVRNAWGEVTAIMHADQNITRISRDETGRIDLISQGPDVVVRDKKEAQETYGPSIQPNTSLRVRLSVNSRGDQYWTGRNGTTRTVMADGTVVLAAPNGHKSFYSPNGAVRHQFPGRVGTSITEVSDFPNGDIEWKFSDGTVGRHAAHGSFLEFLGKGLTPVLDRQGRPQRLRGSVAVNPTGDLAFLRSESRVLRVSHAGGADTEFAHAGSAGWQDPGTGEVFADSLTEIQRRLMAIGSAIPGVSSRHHDLARTEGATHYRLTLGLFDLESQAARKVVPRRPVSFLTRRQGLERRLSQVALTADGKAQVTYAASPQPQNVRSVPLAPTKSSTAAPPADARPR